MEATMNFGIPEPEVRGTGTITNNSTGEVIHIWIGLPPDEPKPDTKE